MLRRLQQTAESQPPVFQRMIKRAYAPASARACAAVRACCSAAAQSSADGLTKRSALSARTLCPTDGRPGSLPHCSGASEASAGRK